MQFITTTIPIALGLAFTAGCDSAKTTTSAPIPTPTVAKAAAGTNAVAGIRWEVPPSWTAKADKPMRVATYELPAEVPGECAVFFFPGSGGSVEANIARWSRQFEGSPAASTKTREVAGLSVTLVAIAGTYLAPGGPMMKATGKSANHELFGAIVAAPAGNVFFKATGPAVTLAAHEAALEALVTSVRPSS